MLISILPYVIFFSLALLASYLSYKKAHRLKNRKIIAVIIFFIFLFLVAFLSVSELKNYLSILINGKNEVDIIGISIVLIMTTIYIELTLITDDLIKNIDILIRAFQK